jgi:hypothetical protein
MELAPLDWGFDLSKPVELSDEEIGLIVGALEEAAFFRDARSRVVASAVRKQSRRAGTTPSAGGGDEHQRKAQEYQALASKLKKTRAP